jgi:hypothetical protein
VSTVSDTTPEVEPAKTRSPVNWRRIGLVGTILLLPIEVGAPLYEADLITGGYIGDIWVMLFDIPLLILVIASLTSTPRRIWARDFSLGVGLLLFLVAAAGIAFVFHPSPSGINVVLRLAMAVFLAMEITRLDKKRFRSRVAVPLLIAAGIQSTIAILQVATGGPLGLGSFGERSVLVTFGGSTAAQGTTIHPYVLAGFSVLAATVAIALLPRDPSRRRWWLFGIALAAVPIGLTYARTGAVGFVLLLIVLVVAAVRDPQRYRAATLALAAGALIPALVFSGGWDVRLQDSATTDIDANSSARLTLIEQSFDLMADSPFVGVGPGRYETVLEASDPAIPQIVHLVPALIAAEDGIYAGLVSLILLLLLGWRAVRTSPAAIAIVVGLGIWMVFDKFTYAFPSGIAMFAIWLGTLDWLAARRTAVESS